ncbi:hypothetical protein HPB47_023854, partial [Ixodes persulcatus]
MDSIDLGERDFHPRWTGDKRVVEIEGEPISPEDFHGSSRNWMDIHVKRQQRADVLGLTASFPPKRTFGGKTENGPQERSRNKRPRAPRLPEDDIKVIIHPRDSLDTSRQNEVKIQRGILMAAKTSTEEASGDVFRANKDQNIIVMSTPVLENAQRYRGIVEILLDGKRFGAAAYATPPENTAKGVIHGIPEEYTEEDINGNLIGARNLSILQVRRMGRSGSVVIVFEEKKVPYFVGYWTTEKKCFLQKKEKIECCVKGGRVGHRTDVCLRPEERRCKGCWTLNPPAEHACMPACGVCGKAHPTGNRKCRKKFKTPYTVLQRSWEKKRNKQGLLKQGEENFPKLLGDASRSRSRSRAEGRRSRSTSRTGGRRQSGSISGGERHVSWAEMVSRKAPQNKGGNAFAETSQANELAEIKALLKQALEENKALREELNRLKEGTRERVYMHRRRRSPRSLTVWPYKNQKRLAKIFGYKSYGKDAQDKTLVTTMVKRNIPVIEHETGVSTVDHILIETISHEKKDRRSIIVLNVYSSPSKRHRFASLFKASTNIAKRQTLLVAGDFNAPHPDWGNLWNNSHEYGLSLITDPDQPTRRGNHRNQDTTPDLTVVKGTEDALRSNTWEDLGSDHFVLCITTTGPAKPKGKRCKITEWDAFREILEKYGTEDIVNIEEWSESLRAVAERATKVVPEKANVAVADSRLLHLWEAKAKLEQRLRTQKGNRSLRRRRAQLSRTIEAHANQVTSQQWQDTCDGFDGQPNVPRTWNILRHLFDPEGNKTAQRNKALGTLDTTSNEKLAALGLHNTVEEITEAQRVSQLGRLTKSATGRHILASLGIRYERQTGERADVPRRVRKALVIQNIPKHMHPTHHAERRAARSRRGRHGRNSGQPTRRSDLELQYQDVGTGIWGARIVVSDSQQAIRQFAKGRISAAAFKVLGDPEKTSTRVQLIWTPAHSSLPGNEKAHGAARELAHRAGEPLDPSLAFFSGGDRLVRLRDILDHYTGERLRSPPAHPSLDKRTSVAWRRLQTGSFPSPSLLSKWYPDKYKPNCKLCGGHANLRHMVWKCSRIDRKSHPLLEKIDHQESWETLLLGSDPSVQNPLVQLAEDAPKTQRVQAAVCGVAGGATLG